MRRGIASLLPRLGTSFLAVLPCVLVALPAQVIEELSAPGTVTKRYTYGHALLAQRDISASKTLYYHHDPHGSVRLLTDSTGNTVKTYTYDAFGILLKETTASPVPPSNNYRYAGEQWDSDLGMYYLRARYYDPDKGRFITMDTFEGTQQDPLSLHKYLYAAADPVNHIDPSGNDFSLSGMLVSSGIGATIGALSAGAAAEAQGRAVTLREVVWGASIGAVLGPVAAYVPAVAVGAGIGGALYSGLSFGPILFDPGATPAQKRASMVLIASSMYGAYAGMKMTRAPINEFENAPTAPPGDEVVLEHGTTMQRALSIFRDGPDEGFVEPGGPPAGGFSTSRVDAPSTPVGGPGDYAAGKSIAFPNEGGPAILRIAVPRDIVNKAIRAGNEVRFERGHGLEELLAVWHKSVWRYPPKKQ